MSEKSRKNVLKKKGKMSNYRKSSQNRKVVKIERDSLSHTKFNITGQSTTIFSVNCFEKSRKKA